MNTAGWLNGGGEVILLTVSTLVSKSSTSMERATLPSKSPAEELPFSSRSGMFQALVHIERIHRAMKVRWDCEDLVLILSAPQGPKAMPHMPHSRGLSGVTGADTLHVKRWKKHVGG
jgi:hypothetical protein